jgi:rubrerythrin
MDTHPIALSTGEIVQDLLHIHNERIRIYTQALHSGKELELDIRSIFERIIEESMKCRQQLNGKILEEPNDDGKVYKAWAGVKAKEPFIGTSRKAILEACMDDELAVLNAYSMALSFAPGKDIKELLLDQQLGLQQLHAHIRKYHDAQ